MKIGDSVSYTFIDKKTMVNSVCIYEHCEAITINGMVIAVKGDIAYLKTNEGTIQVMTSQLQKKPQSKRKRL
jgi:hypothetical protein